MAEIWTLDLWGGQWDLFREDRNSPRIYPVYRVGLTLIFGRICFHEPAN